jgi:hypothetical protein
MRSIQGAKGGRVKEEREGESGRGKEKEKLNSRNRNGLGHRDRIKRQGMMRCFRKRGQEAGMMRWRVGGMIGARAAAHTSVVSTSTLHPKS